MRTNQLMSTVDIFPTVMDILSDFSGNEGGIVRGGSSSSGVGGRGLRDGGEVRKADTRKQVKNKGTYLSFNMWSYRRWDTYYGLTCSGWDFATFSTL